MLRAGSPASRAELYVLAEGLAEPATPLVDEAVTRHGFNMHASLAIAPDDDLGRATLPLRIASAVLALALPPSCEMAASPIG